VGSLEYSESEILSPLSSKVYPLIIEIAEKASDVIHRCPICGCETLWLKEIRMTDCYYEMNRDINDGHAWSEYSILFKCDRCAYVNTTLPVKVRVSGVYTLTNTSYEHFSPQAELVMIGGKVFPFTGFRPIGRKFWNIPHIDLPNITCYCDKDIEIVNFNPFYRNNFGGMKQYRCDITCRCKSNHILSFGVHITEEDYKILSKEV